MQIIFLVFLSLARNSMTEVTLLHTRQPRLGDRKRQCLHVNSLLSNPPALAEMQNAQNVKPRQTLYK
jgi:hypothetical protein